MGHFLHRVFIAGATLRGGSVHYTSHFNSGEDRGPWLSRDSKHSQSRGDTTRRSGKQSRESYYATLDVSELISRGWDSGVQYSILHIDHLGIDDNLLDGRGGSSSLAYDVVNVIFICAVVVVVTVSFTHSSISDCWTLRTALGLPPKSVICNQGNIHDPELLLRRILAMEEHAFGPDGAKSPSNLAAILQKRVLSTFGGLLYRVDVENVWFLSHQYLTMIYLPQGFPGVSCMCMLGRFRGCTRPLRLSQLNTMTAAGSPRSYFWPRLHIDHGRWVKKAATF